MNVLAPFLLSTIAYYPVLIRLVEAWYDYDKSVLVTLVIVKTSNTTASLFPAYVNVDHISKEEVIGVNTKGDNYIETKMLLKNLD